MNMTSKMTNNFEVWSGATRSIMNAGDTQFTNPSSRTYKDNIKPVIVPDILNKLEAIPVMTYDYKPSFCGDGQACKNRLGLIAEDFHTVFGRGSTKLIRHISLGAWPRRRQLREPTR